MLVLGDAHADDPENRAALLRAYDDSDAGRALQVGDLLHYDLPVETWFIAGNNEDLDIIEAMRAGAVPEGVSNAHLLASDVVELDGRRIGGLSGNHAPTQYEKGRDELSGARRRHFTHEDVEVLEAVGDVDVLLTHEVPHGLVTSEPYDPGCKHVDALIQALEPELCLTGHHHEHVEGQFGDSRVYCLAPVWESYYELDLDSLALDRFETPGV